MGNSVSTAEKLMRTKKDELNRLMKILDLKREQFELRVLANRGTSVSETEVNGGRTVVRQTQIRIATSASPNSQIKSAIGSFFEAAQGGNKGKDAMITGATHMVSAGIDAIFGVSAGQGMEKKGFLVLFMNFAFVRVDYFIYSYCVTGKKWGSENSVAGSVQVTDMAVLDPATLSPMEIDYLIGQNVTIDDKDDTAQFNAMMQIKIMLSTNAVLSRIIKSKRTNFDTLSKTMIKIRAIMEKMSTQLSILPPYVDPFDLLGKQSSDLLAESQDGDDAHAKSNAKMMLAFIEAADGLHMQQADWDDLKPVDVSADHSADDALQTLKAVIARQNKLEVWQKDLNESQTSFDDLITTQKFGVQKLLGISSYDWNSGLK